jgi:hypothetical protein
VRIGGSGSVDADADAVRDDVRQYVVDELGDSAAAFGGPSYPKVS